MFDATHQLDKVHGASLVEAPAVGRREGPEGCKPGRNAGREMIVKRVFVPEGHGFDGWVGGEAWVSEHEAVRKKFMDKSLAVREEVFWNVGTSKMSMLVVAAQAGVALVSGYSKNLVRLFLEADGVLTPSAIMADAISGPNPQVQQPRGAPPRLRYRSNTLP